MQFQEYYNYKQNFLSQSFENISHLGQNSKEINIVKHVSEFLIYCAKMLDKCNKDKENIFLYFDHNFCKVKLS